MKEKYTKGWKRSIWEKEYEQDEYNKKADRIMASLLASSIILGVAFAALEPVFS